jgi:hypothetical protein
MTRTGIAAMGLLVLFGCSGEDTAKPGGIQANSKTPVVIVVPTGAGSSGGGAGSAPLPGLQPGSMVGAAGGPSSGAIGSGAAGFPSSAPGMSGGLAGSAANPAGRPANTPMMMPMAVAMGPVAPPKYMSNKDPKIPAMKGECPSLETGKISMGGLSDIEIKSGPMPAEPVAPMLIYWHGTGGQSGEYNAMAGPVANGVISQGGLILSFGATTNMGDCSASGTFVVCTGDIEIVDQVVACAVAKRNIDPHRIYTMGCSAGGLFSAAVAANRSSYIAAAAPNSGGWVFAQTFDSDHTPSLMTVHGKSGTDVVIVDFAQTSATAVQGFKSRSAFVIDCDTGGQHCGGSPLAPDVWKFFEAHPFGVTPEPWMGKLPDGFSMFCTIK